jgi:hypothetical protein
VQTLSRLFLEVASDGTLEVSADDADPLIRHGWRKLGEWIDPEPFDVAQLEEQNKPQGPKVCYAKGSIGREAEQEEQKLAAIAAEEREKKRIARVAAVMRRTL